MLRPIPIGLLALLPLMLCACAAIVPPTATSTPTPVSVPVPTSTSTSNLTATTTGPTTPAPDPTGQRDGDGTEASDPEAIDVDANELEAQATPTQELLEITRSSARSTAEWLARGVDSWFGDLPFREGGKVSDGRLSISWLRRQDQGNHVDVRFNAHFRLPNVERRAYLLVGRDDRRDVIRDTPDALLRQQQLLDARRADRSFIAALGLSLDDAVDFRLGFSHGVKPYAQARYDLPWAFASGHRLDFRETVFWTKADRVGSTTALSYDVIVSPTLALRWLNGATITQETRNLEWSSSIGAYQSLGRQRVVSLEGLFSGSGTRGTGLGQSDRGVLVKYEQPIYKRWLLAEFVGGHFWPRPDATSERGRAWATGASLKLRF